MPTFNCIFENQLIASGILTQLCRYKRAESNLLSDEKGPQQGDPGSCLVIHLYFSFATIKKNFGRKGTFD